MSYTAGMEFESPELSEGRAIYAAAPRAVRRRYRTKVVALESSIVVATFLLWMPGLVLLAIALRHGPLRAVVALASTFVLHALMWSAFFAAIRLKLRDARRRVYAAVERAAQDARNAGGLRAPVAFRPAGR